MEEITLPESERKSTHENEETRKIKNKISRISNKKNFCYTIFAIAVIIFCISIPTLSLTSLFVTIIFIPNRHNIQSSIGTEIFRRIKENPSLPATFNNCQFTIENFTTCDFPLDWHPCGHGCSTFQHATLATIDIFGIILSFVNLFSWILLKKVFVFTHFGIFIVACILTVQLYTYSIIDIVGPNYYLSRGENLGVMATAKFHQDRVQSFVIAIYISNFIWFLWLLFSLFNIFLCVIFPTMLIGNQKRRIKRIIPWMEISSTFICIIIVQIATTLNSNKYEFYPFSDTIITSHNEIIDSTHAFTLLHFIGVLTLALLIPCLIQMDSFKAILKGESTTTLSTLEKRFIIFLLVLMPCVMMSHSINIWFSYVFEEWTRNVYDTMICQNLASLSTTQMTSGENIYESDWTEICQDSDKYDTIFPSAIFIMTAVFKRLIIFVGLLVTMPNGFFFNLKDNIKICTSKKSKKVFQATQRWIIIENTHRV